MKALLYSAVSCLETHASGNSDDDIKGPEVFTAAFTSQRLATAQSIASVVASETGQGLPTQ